MVLLLYRRQRITTACSFEFIAVSLQPIQKLKAQQPISE